MSRTKIAIIGGGPIGIEAALAAVRRGHAVSVFEAGRVGEHWRRFHWLTLFTPFGLNSTRLGREALLRAGAALPAEDAILTAGEHVERYLEPLTRLPELAGCVREHVRVAAVGREGVLKRQAIAAAGDRTRLARPFVLRVEPPGGESLFESADVVIDATGTYGTPGATGPGGLPALGEEHLGMRVDRHLAEILGAARSRYARRRVLLIGNGYSAATALVDFDALASRGEGADVDWVIPAPPTRAADPFPVIPRDALPERVGLSVRANRIAREAPWLTVHPGATVESYETWDGALRVVLAWPSRELAELEVDQVLALVGYRPDTTITRELQVHHCYATEGPMALATALLASAPASSAAADDCLQQTAHGAETLRTPEPGFFILGAKSYGRNPQFLLTLGHRQIDDVLSLVAADRAARAAARVG